VISRQPVGKKGHGNAESGGRQETNAPAQTPKRYPLNRKKENLPDSRSSERGVHFDKHSKRKSKERAGFRGTRNSFRAGRVSRMRMMRGKMGPKEKGGGTSKGKTQDRIQKRSSVLRTLVEGRGGKLKKCELRGKAEKGK